MERLRILFHSPAPRATPYLLRSSFLLTTLCLFARLFSFCVGSFVVGLRPPGWLTVVWGLAFFHPGCYYRVVVFPVCGLCLTYFIPPPIAFPTVGPRRPARQALQKHDLPELT